MKWLILLLISMSAHAENACEILKRCKICNKCEINYDKCVKKAKKDKYEINTCDFLLSVCKESNKCEEQK